jgi:DNA end-binding protein Ku
MAPRPTWQGHLRLSLVTCPVALYTATSSASDISFHLINPKTDNRIRMIATDPDTGPVERSTLVKGYEFEKDQHVILTDEEIESVRIETSRTIDIDRFVDEDEIDRLYWNDPFYLVPDGKLAAEAYAVIRSAMESSGRIAIGRVVLHQRERIMALEPRGKGIVANSLRSYDEVRQPEPFFKDIPDVKPDKGMIDIAGKIVEQLSGEFDPESFRDRYEDALRKLIDAKLKGKKPTVNAPEPEDTGNKDLMEMLRKSLQHAGAPAPRRGEAKAATPKHKAATPHKRAGRRA